MQKGRVVLMFRRDRDEPGDRRFDAVAHVPRPKLGRGVGAVPIAQQDWIVCKQWRLRSRRTFRRHSAAPYPKRINRLLSRCNTALIDLMIVQRHLDLAQEIEAGRRVFSFGKKLSRHLLIDDICRHRCRRDGYRGS